MAFPRLERWQVGVLVAPVGAIASLLLVAAAIQIHSWGISWIWAVVLLGGVGWRWLAARWLREQTVLGTTVETTERAIADLKDQAATIPDIKVGDRRAIAAQEVLDNCLIEAAEDGPIWENWEQFWQRCQELVRGTALVYHPDEKYPLLNIYVPQAYGLIRGTVDDLDRWMQQLSPILGRVTIAQAVGAYETYQKWEPSVQRLSKVWNLAQWVLNPAVAAARLMSQGSGDRATQELVSNLGQLMREAALRNLSAQAIALYSQEDYQSDGSPKLTLSTTLSTTPKPVPPQTSTLREIFNQATPPETVETQPVNVVLMGRTGAGKSSLVNTLFSDRLAETDVLPSTDEFAAYQWTLETGERLQLWDSPGYEQVDGAVGRDRLVDVAQAADVIVLVMPALDPAPMMDREFLQAVQGIDGDNTGDRKTVPVVAVVTQVDRVRPKREWEPPYDWRRGDRPKEINIRDAVAYREEVFGEKVTAVVPLVTWEGDRPAWEADALAKLLLAQLEPAKQERLARFLQSLEARSVAAAGLIDKYVFQMSTTQGLTTFLKSPALQFISTLTTGQPGLAYLLAEKIPVEQLPVVLGKLQMAYDLFNLLSTPDFTQVSDLTEANSGAGFNLLELWTLLLPATDDIAQDAQAFGKALVEYWTQDLTAEELSDRYKHHLAQ